MNSPPITQQPGAGGPPDQMLPPGVTTPFTLLPFDRLPGAPPFEGLEPLAPFSHLLVSQEATDTFFNAQNFYHVLAPNGALLFSIVEQTGLLLRAALGGNQPWTLIMKDLLGRDVVLIEGAAMGGAMRFAGVSVMYGPWRIGGVNQITAGFGPPHYAILDYTGRTVLTLGAAAVGGGFGGGGGYGGAYYGGGDCCCCPYGAYPAGGGPVVPLNSPAAGLGGRYGGGRGFMTGEFPILQTDGQMIGLIGKQWGGIVREMFTTADTYGVSFPYELPVEMKATLLAAAVMIDFQFYERNGSRRHPHGAGGGLGLGLGFGGGGGHFGHHHHRRHGHFGHFGDDW